MEPIQDKKQKINAPILVDTWCDIQDEDDIWRVGYCIKIEGDIKTISIDGFHPTHNCFYCQHQNKILPVRSMTMGLTVLENKKPLRKVLTLSEIQKVKEYVNVQTNGKLSLLGMKTNQLQNSPQSIRNFIRTQLLILIDKIINTPFEILSSIKMADLHINKLFLNIVTYFFKVLDSSKKFISQLQSHQSAKELYLSIYQLTIIVKMIMGIHKRSKLFFQTTMNRTIKSQGFTDYFLKSEGVLPIKLFLKNALSIKNYQPLDYTVASELITLFVDLCQKEKGQLIEGKMQSTTKIVLEEIISFIKCCSEKHQNIQKIIKNNMELISRIETLHLKLNPNKVCLLRKFLENQKQKYSIHQNQKKKVKTSEKQNQKIKDLEERLAKLEQFLPKLSKSVDHKNNYSFQNVQNRPLPTQNLGEQAFLGSLEWALEAGDINACKKLVKWRRSLLQLGRITGWEVALTVGLRTFKKKQITHDDIIEANYQYILKQAHPQPEK